MPAPRENGLEEQTDSGTDDADIESVLTSPADVASAGRSCMAILVLLAVIMVLLVLWIGYRSTGGGP
ncbi:MAG: hypothetical protein H0T18_02270 [Chloroflexia bacterium]|nr:hypothetical protein [Chloroflexia bacterium]